MMFGLSKKKIAFAWITFFMGFTLLIGFNNCAEVKFEKANDRDFLPIGNGEESSGDPDYVDPDYDENGGPDQTVIEVEITTTTSTSTSTTSGYEETEENPGEVILETTTTTITTTSTTSSTTTPTTLPEADEDDVDEVAQACQNTDLERFRTSPFTVFFPDPNVTCPFGQGDNLVRRNNYFQARIEQSQNLDLPEGSVICDVSFDFPQQRFRFDDIFLFTLNSAILASSFDFTDRVSSVVNVPIYKWTDIAGTDWRVTNQSREGVHCLSDADGGGSYCEWPATDTRGNISMNFSSSLMQRVMALDRSRNSHEFKIITIGDNDDYDCEHSNISFDVSVDYVIPSASQN